MSAATQCFMVKVAI